MVRNERDMSSRSDILSETLNYNKREYLQCKLERYVHMCIESENLQRAIGNLYYLYAQATVLSSILNCSMLSGHVWRKMGCNSRRSRFVSIYLLMHINQLIFTIFIMRKQLKKFVTLSKAQIKNSLLILS